MKMGTKKWTALSIAALLSQAAAFAGGSEIGNGKTVPEAMDAQSDASPLPAPYPGHKEGGQAVIIAEGVVYSGKTLAEGDTLRAQVDLASSSRLKAGAPCKAVFTSPGLPAARFYSDRCEQRELADGSFKLVVELVFPAKTVSRSYRLDGLEVELQGGIQAWVQPKIRDEIQVRGSISPPAGLAPHFRLESRRSDIVRNGEVFALVLDGPALSAPLLHAALRFRLEQVSEGNWSMGELPLTGSQSLEADVMEWLPNPAELSSPASYRIFLRVPDVYRMATRIELTQVLLLTEAWEALSIELPAGFGLNVVR